MLIVFKYLNTDYCKGFANCDFGKQLICFLIIVMTYQFDYKVKILFLFQLVLWGEWHQLLCLMAEKLISYI